MGMGENWMRDLPADVTSRSLVELAIPGSHDSCANSLLWAAPVANDEGRLVRTLGYLRFVRRLIQRWARTQCLTVTEQLVAGIRYFDMRVTIPSCSSLSGIRVLHALYGEELHRVLSEMNSFLEAHPREVIVVDFNHLYNFNVIAYKHLLKVVEVTFGHAKLCPRGEVTQLTLDKMWSNGSQVVVISARERRIPSNSWIWGPSSIISPYANVNRLDRLLPFLDVTLRDHRKGPRNILYVSQGVLTAKKRDVCFHPRSSLEIFFARKCTEELISWIQSYEKPSYFNIIICDFVDTGGFCDTVISLNHK
uniref:PI-PLC X domain-containing protein 3 n=2 Tax=Parascaris TaxID=6254 RepID=A0A915ABL8_PARUN